MQVRGRRADHGCKRRTWRSAIGRWSLAMLVTTQRWPALLPGTCSPRLPAPMRCSTPPPTAALADAADAGRVAVADTHGATGLGAAWRCAVITPVGSLPAPTMRSAQHGRSDQDAAGRIESRRSRSHCETCVSGRTGGLQRSGGAASSRPHAETLPCKTFDEVFDAVVQKRATHGVVPMENSIGGTIHRNYDLLVDHEIPITGEVELDVVHCLQALPGTQDRGREDRLLAPAGAGAVRTLSEGSRRHRRSGLRHGRRREAGGGAAARERRGAGVAARGRGVRPRGAPGSRAGLRVQHHPLLRHRRRAAGRRQQDDDRVCAAEHARVALQGAERVRAARHQPEQAREPADPRPPLGVPVLRGHRGAPRRSAVRPRAHAAGEFAKWTRILGTYKGTEKRAAPVEEDCK